MFTSVEFNNYFVYMCVHNIVEQRLNYTINDKTSLKNRILYKYRLTYYTVLSYRHHHFICSVTSSHLVQVSLSYNFFFNHFSQRAIHVFLFFVYAVVKVVKAHFDSSKTKQKNCFSVICQRRFFFNFCFLYFVVFGSVIFHYYLI